MVRPNEQSIEKHEVLREVEHVPAAVCYLFEELGGGVEIGKQVGFDAFTFQYWPESINDTYTPNYNEVPIPGGSHPLYQYVGGGERSISFTATFTSEVKDSSSSGGFSGEHIDRYTVDVKGAIARLQRYLYPHYGKGGVLGVVEAPPKLVLSFPGTNLGRDRDEVLVILREAPVTYTHWYPDGTPRIAQLELMFSETVQHRRGKGTQIKFIGSSVYAPFSKTYNF